MELTFLIAMGSVVVILSAWLAVVVASQWRSRKIRKCFNKGFRAEQQAQTFLQNHGFCILASQPVIKATMWLDGQPQTYTVRADYLVKKGGKKSLVEVKSGSMADPKQRHTRRQLFEYLHLYRVHRLYLFDAQQNRLIRIRFSKQSTHRALRTCLVFVLGALCTWLLVTFRQWLSS